MDPDSATPAVIRACPCCGLVQQLPVAQAGSSPRCLRCDSRFHSRFAALRSNSRTAAVATAALILYPLAISLPMLEIEKFGHQNRSSIVEGIISLLSQGHLLIGIVVLLCSIIFPLGKLLALLTLSMGGIGLGRHHQALAYRVVEWTGRWGMLDVLLVSILIAAVKLGDLVEVRAGPAAFAFTICVVLSLIATACFDPHQMWNESFDSETTA